MPLPPEDIEALEQIDASLSGYLTPNQLAEVKVYLARWQRWIKDIEKMHEIEKRNRQND